MLERTDSKHAPWTVVRANDKRRLRLNVIRTLLDGFDFEGKNPKTIGKIDDKIILSAEQFLQLNGE